ncbi:hypothetical protein DENSPDRAFT_882500 [Dentipellis sp. KUC8613]|nr:hypothetical protein DENSPDRAFT_882500 [Dentipellis sp. KUC8613]
MLAPRLALVSPPACLSCTSRAPVAHLEPFSGAFRAPSHARRASRAPSRPRHAPRAPRLPCPCLAPGAPLVPPLRPLRPSRASLACLVCHLTPVVPLMPLAPFAHLSRPVLRLVSPPARISAPLVSPPACLSRPSRPSRALALVSPPARLSCPRPRLARPSPTSRPSCAPLSCPSGPSRALALVSPPEPLWRPSRASSRPQRASPRPWSHPQRASRALCASRALALVSHARRPPRALLTRLSHTPRVPLEPCLALVLPLSRPSRASRTAILPPSTLPLLPPCLASRVPIVCLVHLSRAHCIFVY